MISKLNSWRKLNVVDIQIELGTAGIGFGQKYSKNKIIKYGGISRRGGATRLIASIKNLRAIIIITSASPFY